MNGERLNLKDLEFDIINYFNQFLEEKDKVDLSKEKELREIITDLKHVIKKDIRSIKRIDATSDEIHSDLDISFDEGTFSIDGKRINASGYIPSVINSNDDFYSFSDVPILKMVDLSQYFSAVKDQGELGSCTAFPIATVYEFAAMHNKKNTDVSELFIYYNARVQRGNINEDTGASLLDAIDGVKENGACFSGSYPYAIEKYMEVPAENAFIEAKHQVVERACRVKINEIDFKHAIVSGHPVIFGLKLYESFYPKNASGIIKYPSSEEALRENHGHHAMLIVGYNDDEKLFKVRNSWGNQFGDNGYCYIPYDYAANPEFCHEAFVITKIVDLAFNEFNYNSVASFSFLKDKLIRKKTIIEYNLRAKNKELVEKTNEYQVIAIQNEENTEQIKDAIFRKNLLNTLKSKIPVPSPPNPIPTISKTNDKKWYYILGVGILLFLISLISALLSTIVTIVGSLIALGLIVFSFMKIKTNKQKVKEEPTIKYEDAKCTSTSSELYIFRVADRLFDQFEEMDNQLITRYRALSKYYSKVKQWKEENLNMKNEIDYSSPSFVINVVEEKPLLEYLINKKEKFLKKMPNLSGVFHHKYDVINDNVDEVFAELKKNYLDDIKQNIDSILDVSIVDYLLGTKYEYFNDPPKINELFLKLEKLSKPFCNIKSSFSADIPTQHFELVEEITTNRIKKNNNLVIHQNADIRPIRIEIQNNKKKYVYVQVATIDCMENLVRFGQE